VQRILHFLLSSPQAGLALVICLLGGLVAAGAGSVHVDNQAQNKLLNSGTLMELATQASFFAIMAAGMTMVIISGGIDLSVGAIYALAGVGMALFFRQFHDVGANSPMLLVALGLACSLAVGTLCGLLNGLMTVGLKVHPFIITLGMMWILRGIAFVSCEGQSILVPDALTAAAKASLGLRRGLYPVPLLAMVLVTVLGWLYLEKTVMGRHVFAVGGNPEAARFAGLRSGRVLVSVYTISGLVAGLAAFLGASYYGSAGSGDGTGYELYVIAAAVVGGSSLAGGRGSVLGATLGAVLIVLIRQSIVILGLNQQYEFIIVGVALIVAVVLDRVNAKMAAQRLAAEAAAVKAAEMRPEGETP